MGNEWMKNFVEQCCLPFHLAESAECVGVALSYKPRNPAFFFLFSFAKAVIPVVVAVDDMLASVLMSGIKKT